MWDNMYPLFGMREFGWFGFWGGWIFLTIAIIWSIVWKGLALWKAAREESKPWFIVLLVLNTFGILEILYLYVFGVKSHHAKHHDSEEK